MTFERRDFLKAGTIGMVTAMATPAFAFDEESAAKGKGELEGGCSSIRLEGQLKAGHIVIEARSFEDGHDRAVVMRSKLEGVDEAVVGVCLALFALSATVMIAKFTYLAKASKANAAFMRS